MPTIPFHKPGVTYNGLHATPNPTSSQVSADLAATRAHFDHVRTYYPQYGGGAVDVGKVAKDAGMSLLLGLYLFDNHDWTEGNYQSFIKPAVARGNVVGILVGNEDPQMLDNGIIAKYLGQSKRDFPQAPVGTSQKSDFWLSDPRAAQLLPLVDSSASTSTGPGSGIGSTTTTSRSGSRPKRASLLSAIPSASSGRNIRGARSW